MMYTHFILVSLLFITSPLHAKNYGKINIKGYGDIYITARDVIANTIQMDSNGFTLNGGGNIQFSKEPRDDFSPDMYWAVSNNISDGNNINFITM